MLVMRAFKWTCAPRASAEVRQRSLEGKDMPPALRQWLVLVALTLVVTSLPAVAQVVTATVQVGRGPDALAVNANKIYVTNVCGDDPTCQSPGTVSVIDGTTLSTRTVTIGFSGSSPHAVDVDSQANKIYVTNGCGSDSTCGSMEAQA
jgi:hypothetical protein